MALRFFSPAELELLAVGVVGVAAVVEGTVFPVSLLLGVLVLALAGFLPPPRKPNMPPGVDF